jgi:hypothetical protein
MRLDQLLNTLPQFEPAGAFAVQKRGPFGRIGHGDGSGKQIEFVHRMGPPTIQRNWPTKGAAAAKKNSRFLLSRG